MTNEPTARLLSLCVQCPPGLRLHWRAKLTDRRHDEDNKEKKGHRQKDRRHDEDSKERKSNNPNVRAAPSSKPTPSYVCSLSFGK